MNIDLKAFTPDFYRKLGGDPEAVKETIALAYKRCHVEITTLVIPGENEDDIPKLAAWLASISPDIPLHLSRLSPRHKYVDRQPTPRKTVRVLAEAAGQYLRHIFVGNM